MGVGLYLNLYECQAPAKKHQIHKNNTKKQKLDMLYKKCEQCILWCRNNNGVEWCFMSFLMHTRIFNHSDDIVKTIYYKLACQVLIMEQVMLKLAEHLLASPNIFPLLEKYIYIHLLFHLFSLHSYTVWQPTHPMILSNVVLVWTREWRTPDRYPQKYKTPMTTRIEPAISQLPASALISNNPM